MGALYLLNAFSLNMLEDAGEMIPRRIDVIEVPAGWVHRTLLSPEEGYVSAVGHADTAEIFSDILGFEIPYKRVTVSLKTGDDAIVGQYIGPRLPEGTKTLPEGATIKWLYLKVRDFPVGSGSL